MPEPRRLEDLLAVLQRPLDLERRMGYRNASAVGGLDRYVGDWALRCREAAGDAGCRGAMDRVRALFADYAVLPPAQRAERMSQARSVLDEVAAARGGEPTRVAVAAPPLRPHSPQPPLQPEALRAPGAVEAPVTIDRAASGERVPDLDAPLVKLRGVGVGTARRLEKLGLRTVGDLLWHLPRRHEDRRNMRRIRELEAGETVTVSGLVTGVTVLKPRPGLTLIKAVLNDGTGSLTLVWFNVPYLRRALQRGMRLLACGKAERKFGSWQMASPEFEPVSEDEALHAGRIVPVYALTEQLNQRGLRKLMKGVVERHAVQVREILPSSVRGAQGLMVRAAALAQMHFPESMELRDAAFERLVFEELFTMQVGLALRRREAERIPRGLTYDLDGDPVRLFEAALPFPLTGAQRRVLGEVVSDMRQAIPMSRLVQGDVGSGKTVVAAFAAWAAASSGNQAAIMAPTEILAEQLARKVQDLIGDRLSVRLLKGSMAAREKDDALTALALGEADVAVGTHALIQEGVRFARLALAVIDEQHKFGVMQRGLLRSKGYHPDVLVMTATPIPRTLALTVYGDLDTSCLDELPPGRSPIKSWWARSAQAEKAYGFVRKQVAEGRQAYLVCPLIEESEKVEASAATAEFERISRDVLPDLKVGLLHGRMKSEAKDAVMEAFRRGEIQVLVSTTVIEVGVDVPNATVMLIQSADRFGLAQLHQLRGRVGRGAHQSYCVFLADPPTGEGAKRMRVIEGTTDGFRIAEEDLRFRGPGEFYGARQSGLPDLRVADLVRDRKVLERARRAAWELVTRDPTLALQECLELRGEVRRTFRGQLGHLLS